ncbi:MAG: hypothetical protein ABSB78_14205 [Bacteroidota bacterium]
MKQDAIIVEHNRKLNGCIGIIFQIIGILIIISFISVIIQDINYPIKNLICIILISFPLLYLIIWISIWYLKALLRINPAFVINKYGFYDNTEPWSPGCWVYWNEVKGWYYQKYLFWKVIVIKLKTRDGIVNRQISIIRKIYFRSKLMYPIDEVRGRINTLSDSAMGFLVEQINEERRLLVDERD